MDLLGTVVLPVAIALTYTLIVGIAFSPPKSFEEAIPLMLLIAVLGLPAVLILITTRKVVYVFWMLIYLLALPIWNFVLPVYAFWHFDDFSWGETRKVEGEGKDKGHGAGGRGDTGPAVAMRRWEDWERSRLRKLKREERRRRDFERTHPSGYIAGERDFLVAPDARSQYDGSDTLSLNSSDDDHWGTQIGGYNEHNSQFPPPPAFIHQGDILQSAKTVDGAELEAMLEMGFDDRLPTSPSTPRYQLSDGSPTDGNGYAPLAQLISPGASQASFHNPTSPSHMSRELPGNSQRLMSHGGSESGHSERYGPLGPLDPSARF